MALIVWPSSMRTSSAPVDSRHAIQDFTYSASYLDDYVLGPREGGGNGGSGIERHDFDHFDCPLNAESGAFILAKFVDEEEETVLHISGTQFNRNI